MVYRWNSGQTVKNGPIRGEAVKYMSETQRYWTGLLDLSTLVHYGHIGPYWSILTIVGLVVGTWWGTPPATVEPMNRVHRWSARGYTPASVPVTAISPQTTVGQIGHDVGSWLRTTDCTAVVHCCRSVQNWQNCTAKEDCSGVQLAACMLPAVRRCTSATLSPF